MLKIAEETKETPKVDEIPIGWYRADVLPSKYLAYPPGTQILFRPLTVLEVTPLATMTSDNADSVINAVLKSSTRGIEIEDMVIADKIFLIMNERANTYKGDRFALDYVCPECGTEGKYEFDIAMISMDDVKEGWTLDTEYDIDGHKVKLDQPRVKDLERTRKYLLEHIEADNEILSKIAYRIWSIDGKEVDIDEAYQFSINLPPSDFVKLNGICGDTEMTLDPTVKVKCTHCGKEVPQRVSFRPDFFVPEYTGW